MQLLGNFRLLLRASPLTRLGSAADATASAFDQNERGRTLTLLGVVSNRKRQRRALLDDTGPTVGGGERTLGLRLGTRLSGARRVDTRVDALGCGNKTATRKVAVAHYALGD
jgi:hypothetical protein